MQSKTSFFNKTVFRKNVTRFAPVWGAYTLALLAAMLILVVNGGDNRNYWPVSHMMDMSNFMALVNCGYALLIAQLLFGDLYNARSCYGLHAMPLRRETWFVTHILSGLVFAIGPMLVMTLVALPIAMASVFVGGWQVPLVVFAASTVQYILFFGLAVFCAFCAGNRVGMIGIYGGLNIVSVLTGYALENICDSIMLGVDFPMDPFYNFSPVQGFLKRHLFFVEDNFYQLREDMRKGLITKMEIHFGYNTEHFGYYGICALVGVGLILLGLWLYKKRHLECAGDFLAFPQLEPVFSVAAALCAGMVARLMYTSASNTETDYYLAMAFGIIVGWFVARMLLERTARVFKKKNFKGLGILLVAAAACIGLIHLDPMGVEHWVPEPEDLQSATFGRFGYGYEAETSEDMDKLLRLHELALEQYLTEDYSGGYRRDDYIEGGVKEDAQWGVDIAISYVKKNGQKVSRHYVVLAETEAGELAKYFMSKPEIAVYRRYSNGELPVSEFKTIWLQNGPVPAEYCTTDQIAELFAAIEADCLAGNMAQLDALHNGYFHWTEVYQGYHGEEDRTYEYKNSSIQLNLDGGPEGDAYFYINLYMDSKNTLNWLESRGLLEKFEIAKVETDRPYDELRERETAEQK